MNRNLSPISKKKPIRNTITITRLVIAAAVGLGIMLVNIATVLNLNQSTWSAEAYAQMIPQNSSNSNISSSNTLIGDIILSSTNDTATTIAPNATGANATGIQKSQLAENLTSATAFTKENSTAPVSPTGISTQSERAPPSTRIVNNTLSATNATNTNNTRENIALPVTSNNSIIQDNNSNNVTSAQTVEGGTPNQTASNTASKSQATTTSQQQQQNQTDNPLSKIPVIGETLENINPFK